MLSICLRAFLRLDGALRRILFFGTGLLACGLNSRAEELPAPEDASKPAVITSISQFWGLLAEEKQQPHPMRLECDVTYFDSAWKSLWIQQDGNGAYVKFGGAKLPMKPGQRILVTGTLLPPNADLSFENATITVLGPSAVKPVEATGRIMDLDQSLNRVVTFEGFVDQQYLNTDGGHLHLTMSVEGRTVYAWVLVDPTKPVPQLADANVRITGVYNPKLTPSGEISSLEIMVGSPENITVLNWLGHDPRFERPLIPISSLPSRPHDQLVRIEGFVKAQEPGRYLRIRDEYGQIDLITGQTRPCMLNERVEAIGYPSISGTEWKLESALYRSRSAPAAALRAAPLSQVRLAAQVLELSPEDAGRGYPAQLTGVVTWSHPEAPFFFISDASGGICVLRGNDTSRVRAPGLNIEVRGVTAMGAYAPVVVSTHTTKLGDLVLPEARQVSLEHALTGAEESQWVEMSGYLRDLKHDGIWTRLELTTSAGNFDAILPATEDVSALVGSVVRVHGVCTAVADEHRKLTGIKLWVPAAVYVQVEEAAPKDSFEAPLRSLESLGQFSTMQSFNRRVKVSGVVVHHWLGHMIHIEQDGATLQVLSRDTVPLTPGDRIEAVGFLGRQRGRVVLREAIYRKTGEGPKPSPQMLGEMEKVRPDLDGRLVRVEGSLLESSATSEQTHLTLQAENTVIQVDLPRGTDDSAMALAAGSRLAVTGVYEVKYDDFGQPGGFRIGPRSAADIVVLASAPWLNTRLMLYVGGVLSCGIILFTAWVAALRRRVGQQTEQIRLQLKRESDLEAELQRATKLESLGLLAGGIAHDFNNLLTVVMGNVSLARLDVDAESAPARCMREAEKAVIRARDLTQQLLTFSKGGSPIRTAVVLPDVVREVAQFAVSGANARCHFDFAADLWPAEVDKGQIGQVVQNIVINATQAMPNGGRIDVRLSNETVGAEHGQMLAAGRYLKLTIGDHGAGVKAEDLRRIFDPYFTTKKHGLGLGLATVYSIIKKHLGHITVESEIGSGTTFHIWLPAANTVPAVASIEVRPPVGSPGQARVLFMDDEEEIRRLGSTMLRHFGHETTAVSDGAEAVHAYQQALQAGSPYDVVILDLTVPGGVGGRQAMEQLLQIDPKVRAIVSSGYSNDQVLSNYRAHGFRGMVSKPYQISDFAHAITAVLKGAHS